MPVPFHEPKLIYPPHPGVTWNPKDLHKIRGFVAQLKYNDWHVLVYLYPGGKIEFYNRRKQKMTGYRPVSSLIDALHALPLSKEHFHVLDGGILHHSTPRFRDVLVLWDILVHDSSYLLGTTYRTRYDLLYGILGCPSEKVMVSVPQTDRSLEIGLRVEKNLWLAPCFPGDLKALFRDASRIPEIEGLVLKDRGAKLERAYRVDSSARWQIRIRRPRIDYAY